MRRHAAANICKPSSRYHSLGERESANLLETIQLILPSPVQLNPHLHTTKNHLLPAFEINAKLDDIAIVDGKSFAFL